VYVWFCVSVLGCMGVRTWVCVHVYVCACECASE